MSRSDRRAAIDHAMLLIVDSDRQLRSRLASALADFHFPVHTVASAEDALRQIGPETRWLVTEVDLPGLTGLELLKICRRLCPTVRIVVTARAPCLTDALVAFRSGAADYLVKPFPLEQLLRALGQAGGLAEIAVPLPVEELLRRADRPLGVLAAYVPPVSRQPSHLLDVKT